MKNKEKGLRTNWFPLLQISSLSNVIIKARGKEKSRIILKNPQV